MTKKDFFRMIIKLFGLYWLINIVFNFIPSNFGAVTTNFEPIVLIWIFGFSMLVVLIFVFLVLKVDKIIDILKVDKGFDDERIELGAFNKEKMFQFALILIGAFLIVDHLAEFLQYCYLAFKKQVSKNGLNFLEDMGFNNSLDHFRWVVSGMNLILGYLLLKNYARIVQWVIKKEESINREE